MIEGDVDRNAFLDFASAIASNNVGMERNKTREFFVGFAKALEKNPGIEFNPSYEDKERSEDELAKLRGLIGSLYDFVVDRLEGYFANQNFSLQQFKSVAYKVPMSLLDFDRRLRAIGEFVKLPEAEALAAANKRIRNILKKADIAIPASVDAALFAEDAERALHAVVEQAIADTDPLLANRDYVAVLGRLARLRPEVDTFFDKVMVNADDLAVRANRLALLQRLADRLGSVAAIEHLSV